MSFIKIKDGKHRREQAKRFRAADNEAERREQLVREFLKTDRYIHIAVDKVISTSRAILVWRGDQDGKQLDLDLVDISNIVIKLQKKLISRFISIMVWLMGTDQDGKQLYLDLEDIFNIAKTLENKLLSTSESMKDWVTDQEGKQLILDLEDTRDIVATLENKIMDNIDVLTTKE